MPLYTHYGPLWKHSSEPIIWPVQEHFSANHLTDNDKTKHNYDQQQLNKLLKTIPENYWRAKTKAKEPEAWFRIASSQPMDDEACSIACGAQFGMIRRQEIHMW